MEEFLAKAGCPVLGFCGYSGSGKTTLLEKLTVALAGNGLAVGYLKHDAHKFEIDRKGKDTDRLFNAGVTALAITSSGQSAARFKSPELGGGAGGNLFGECDIVLVEGYKNSPWAKLWVHPYGGPSTPLRTGGTGEMPELDNLVGQVGGATGFKHDDLQSITDFVTGWLKKKVAEKPLYGGLLIGGKSVRMGSPKSLLKLGDETFAEKQYRLLRDSCHELFLLGSGALPESLRDAPRIADPPGIEGPVAGLVSAGRFAPSADWLILAVDMPNIERSHIDRLIAGRKPGFRCVIAQNPESEKSDPLCALYSSQLLRAVDARREGELSVRRLLKRLGVEPTEGLLDASALKNVNSPDELD